ncbi:unnamed protein product [Closterium sp. Yama58-4]|nr:unnamed protein product [Closterium sp. Yama58-4]
MGLDPRLLRGLVKRRLLKPTPVQQYCVPLAMEGRDVVAMAHTGSGKTLAYLLPLLHRVLADKDSAPAAPGAGGTCPRAVVLVPTRELCQQVADEVTAMAQYCGGAITVQRLTTGMNNSAMLASTLFHHHPCRSRYSPFVLPLPAASGDGEAARRGGGDAGAHGGMCGGLQWHVWSPLESSSKPTPPFPLNTPPPLQRAAMERRPDVVVATPARMAACVAEGVLSPSALKTHLAVMVLDEADVLLSHGYYSEVQAIARHVPASCQCVLLTATFRSAGSLPSSLHARLPARLPVCAPDNLSHHPPSPPNSRLPPPASDDIERLQKLVLHNPVVVRLGDSSGLLEDAQGDAGVAGGVGLGVEGNAAAEAAAAGEAAEVGAGGQGNQNQSLLPPNIRQFAVRCEEKDKLLHLLALIRLQLLQKKVLIFTSTVEAGFRVKLFLEQFGIRAAVLNSELPVASRLHILHDFNAGKFFFLIATDDDNGGLNAKDSGKQGDSGRDAKRQRVRIAEGGEGGREQGEEEVERDTGEYGVVRGIDFKNVRTVINYSVPNQLAPYVHRVGRTGRASSVGMAITLVSPKEVPLLEVLDRKIAQSMACATKCGGGSDSSKDRPHHGSEHGKNGLRGERGRGSSRKRAREGEDEEGDVSEEEGEVEEDQEEGEEEGTDEDEEEYEEEQEDSDESGEEESEEEEEDEEEKEEAKPKPYECRAIVPYPYLPKEGVEALRYRGEDVAGKITRVAIREARAKELRWEILNSEKLKDHFDLNPKDRDLLKHDKVLAKVAPSPHLKVLPTYLRAEAVTEARRKFLTELPPAEQDSRDGGKGGRGGRGGGFSREEAGADQTIRWKHARMLFVVYLLVAKTLF